MSARPGAASPPEASSAARDLALSPWQVATEAAQARRRRMFLAVGVLFTVVTAFFGFPTGREVVTAWVLLVLLAACGGDVRVWRHSVLHDWAPLLAVLFAYDFLRGQANELGARIWDLPALDNGKTGADGTDHAHVLPQLRADEVLFGWLTGGEVPTVWLQDRLYVPGDVQWYDIVIVPVYMSHFLVPMVLAVALWISTYHLFRRYVWTLVTLTVMTLTTYVLFPAAPPWMAALNGYLPEVARVTSVTLQSTGVGTVNNAVQRGEAYANAVAAIPSLHSAVPFLVLLFTWTLVRRRTRLLLVLYVLAMTFTLTYGGEHYVVDAFIGWAYAGVAVYGMAWWFDRRARAGGAGAAREPLPADADG